MNPEGTLIVIHPPTGITFVGLILNSKFGIRKFVDSEVEVNEWV
jgi:hypothetical protein